MSLTRTLGGDRIGAGKKQQVHLKAFERSTHDQSYVFRTTASPGTVIPFMKEIGLPGETKDINLNCEIYTHPATGPLFAGFKVELYVYTAPIRLYHAWLHNNKLGIAMKMETVKFPEILFTARPIPADTQDLDNAQVNPSSLIKYLGIRGFGIPNQTGTEQIRRFHALWILMYWECIKNYYANKQEDEGAVIHSTVTMNDTVVDISVHWRGGDDGIPQAPAIGPVTLDDSSFFTVNYSGPAPDLGDIMIKIAHSPDNVQSLYYLNGGAGYTDTGTQLIVAYDYATFGMGTAYNWSYRPASVSGEISPKVARFPLENIDKMREKILEHGSNTTPFNLNSANLTPYSWLYGRNGDFDNIMNTQEGLAVKTYSSDLLNNWLNTEAIDGVGGITDITSVQTASGEFSIDELIFKKKLYDMLNALAVSGGTYDDLVEVAWGHDKYRRVESPIFLGGLIKELQFQEVISNSETAEQPLGSLAGRGVLTNKHKGGYIHVNVDEPSLIMGLFSLTPRIDNSQGNDWDVYALKTLDDLHKPYLDGIGFQESINEQRAWWDTYYNSTSADWIQSSAGKTTAWLNYQTNINKVYGNFAVPDNEMFMTLNRRYEPNYNSSEFRFSIKDLTTYIDPVKCNYVFADTRIDAMNFWVHIGVGIESRKKMSGRIMPNL